MPAGSAIESRLALAVFDRGVPAGCTTLGCVFWVDCNYFYLTSGCLVLYTQKTWNLETGQPMHEESGYWRLCGPSPNHVEVMIVHAFGVAEVAEGMIEGTHIELVSTAVSMTSTAKTVSALGRSLAVDGDMLHYRLRMSAVGLPAHHHLCADLQRTP